MNNKYNLSYKFQPKDNRDFIFTAIFDNSKKIEIAKIVNNYANPTKITKTIVSPTQFVISNLYNILDQSSLGDCVANAFAYCVGCQTKKSFALSRLYLYAFSRLLDNTPLNQDNGTTIRSTCSAIKKYGSLIESSYPYNISSYSLLPSLQIIQSAKLFKSFTYNFVNQDITSIKNCLNTYNIPIIFGFLVYSSFMSNNVASTGVVPYPDTNHETLQGGHCMNIIGYNDTTKLFTCVNSWGTSWGDKGMCYIPYSYLLNNELASDFCFTQFVY
jgi:C1A family cysteine protease